jgi:hypothetical protein
MSCKAAHHSHYSPPPVSLNASKERFDFKQNAEEYKNHRNSFQKKLRHGTCAQKKGGQNFLAGIILSILNLTMENNFEKDRTYISGVSKRSNKLLTTSYWLHVELRKNI